MTICLHGIVGAAKDHLVVSTRQIFSWQKFFSNSTWNWRHDFI